MKFWIVTFHFFLSLLYPPVCGICGRVGENWICKRCERSLKQEEKEIEQTDLSPYFKKAFFIYSYQGKIKELLTEYKFHSKPYLYHTLTKNILKNEKACRFLKEYDIIIPVPIHKKRKQERGYNQCELLAREIAKKLKIPIESKALVKFKNRPPQSTLKKEERIQAVKGVYKVENVEKIKNKKILLLDDIYTTGSTLAECSKMLKEAGAEEIGIFTIAKD